MIVISVYCFVFRLPWVPQKTDKKWDFSGKVNSLSWSDWYWIAWVEAVGLGHYLFQFLSSVPILSRSQSNLPSQMFPLAASSPGRRLILLAKGFAFWCGFHF